MRSYIGLIHKASDSEFGVTFPDFPGDHHRRDA